MASSQVRKLEQVWARAAGVSQHRPSTSSKDLSNEGARPACEVTGTPDRQLVGEGAPLI
jgi:hypothetical protein